MLVCLLGVPAVLPAQQIFDEFSYAGLRLSGIGIELGVIGSNRLTSEPTGAVRLDYGFIAPNLRLLFGASYFRGDFDDEEIGEFEAKIAAVVTDPTDDFTIDVGTISWADFEASIDLQYVLPYTNRVVPYLGVGLGVHYRNGSGHAIEGTFVEDALDTVAAAANFSVGTHVAVAHPVYITFDLRAGLSTELRTVAGRGGLMFRFTPRPTR